MSSINTELRKIGKFLERTQLLVVLPLRKRISTCLTVITKTLQDKRKFIKMKFKICIKLKE